MPPVVHPFPVKRPAFVEQAAWIGGDEDLALQCSYRDLAGQLQTVSFQTKGQEVGEICLPNLGNDLANLGPRVRDILVAHLRMAVMIAGHAVPGSREFNDIFVQSGTNNFQTALGLTKVVASRMVSDSEVDVDWQIGNGPIYTIRVGHGELSTYTFVPATQLLIIPGAVEKQYPTYVHDWPGTVLTQTQRDNVVNYVRSLEPWV